MITHRDVEVPVLIVGGGGAGLTASILLSRMGVRSLLVTRYPETSRLPRGHILNQRTMEIFTDMDLAPEIFAQGTPPENMKVLGWYSGLAGGGPANGHGRRIGSIEAWGGGYADPDYIAASACPSTNLCLLRLEPILKARAERFPDATSDTTTSWSISSRTPAVRPRRSSTGTRARLTPYGRRTSSVPTPDGPSATWSASS
jgi:2,4-dichlorophenol 6-monooxygenase